MTPDPTAEIKHIRHELGATDGFDIGKIFERLRDSEETYQKDCVRRKPKTPSDNNAMNRSGEFRGS